MIEPTFNECSALPVCDTHEEARRRFSILIKLMKELKKYGINHVRHEDSIYDIPFFNDVTLGSYCDSLREPKQFSNERENVFFLYSVMEAPYAKRGGLQIPPENLKDVQCQDASIGEKIPLGLLAAYVLKSFTIGFDNNVSPVYELEMTFSACEGSNKFVKKKARIVCVSKESDCCDNLDFIELLSSQSDLKVRQLEDSEKNHNISLPKHHGEGVYKKHAKELLSLPYVKGILSTRSFDSGETSYIHKIHSDGSIEVRLYWTKTGFGLWISTSAENIVQAYWIAKFLNKKYGND